MVMRKALKQIDAVSRRAFLKQASIIIGVCLLCVVGCKRSEQSNQIRIGVVLSMTGDVGAYGQRSLHGLLVAQKQINDSGGINGRKLELEIEDARSSPKDAVSAFQKLVDVDKLNIVVGDVLSSTTLAMAPLAQRKKVLLFAPGASNPALRNAGKYFFRNWVSDDFDGKAMAHYMFDSDVKSAYVLYQQTDYCVGLAGAFQKEFEALGGKLAGKEGFMTDAVDFRAQLVKLQSSGAKVVYLVGESRQNGTILLQAQQLGIHVRWFSNLTVDTPECEKLAGSALNGVVFTTPTFDPNSAEPQVKKFVHAYQDEYKEQPDVTAGVAYDALMILASVMRNVGTNVDAIVNGLHKVKDFPGVTGNTTFDEHGDVLKPIFVKEFKNDKPVLIKTYSF